MNEAILEPELPIIDPHHHLWDLRPLLPAFPAPRHDFLEALVGAPYYTFDALQADTQSGHRVIGTVFMECGAFYDASRGEALKTVGEVEFVNGVAAQGASGLYGEYRPCAAIVGHADLTLGSKAGEVLDALQAASPRFVADSPRLVAAIDGGFLILVPTDIGFRSCCRERMPNQAHDERADDCGPQPPPVDASTRGMVTNRAWERSQPAVGDHSASLSGPGGQRFRFSRGRCCSTIGVPTKPNSSRSRRSMNRS